MGNYEENRTGESPKIEPVEDCPKIKTQALEMYRLAHITLLINGVLTPSAVLTRDCILDASRSVLDFSQTNHLAMRRGRKIASVQAVGSGFVLEVASESELRAVAKVRFESEVATIEYDGKETFGQVKAAGIN